jgi:tRNA-Thr(GGU) m(6)t(6)A37 methyltransferase TsaA
MDTYALRPIGVVRSPLKDKAAAPRQGDEGAPAAKIVVLPEARDALDGIEPGAELIVLTWLHQADRDALKVHPRDDLSRPLTGVFATRSSDRPNPVGLHRVTVLGISRGEVEVEPLEAIDGTPVIDLKPVLTSSR